MEHQRIDFVAILVGHIVEATQILPIDLAIVGLVSSRSRLPLGTGVEVAHIRITAEFADRMQAEPLDAVDPLFFGKVAIDDHLLLDGKQMGLDLAQVLEIGIDQCFFRRRGSAGLLFRRFSRFLFRRRSDLFYRLLFPFFFGRGDGGEGRRGIGLPDG